PPCPGGRRPATSPLFPGGSMTPPVSSQRKPHGLIHRYGVRAVALFWAVFPANDPGLSQPAIIQPSRGLGHSDGRLPRQSPNGVVHHRLVLGAKICPGAS